MNNDSAIIVFRTVTEDTPTATGESQRAPQPVSAFNNHRASRYILKNSDNRSIAEITNIADNLHVIRIWGDMDHAFSFLYVPATETKQTYRLYKVAFRLTKGDAVYYLGQIRIDEHGNLFLIDDAQRDLADLFATHPYLQHYQIRRVGMKIFPITTNDREIARALP